jgi:hypothetical protein
VVSRNVNGFGNKRLRLGIQSRGIIVTAADSSTVWGLLKDIVR